MSYKKDTICVQGGYRPKSGESRIPPISQSTTYFYDSTQGMADLFDLKADGYFYSRLANPTVAAFEGKVTELEGGVAGIGCSSGMSATTLAAFTVCGAGDNIVSSSAIYGGTFNLFAVTLPKLGIETRFFDPDAPAEEIEKLIDDNTKMIFTETVANPSIKILDFEKIAAIAKKYEVLFAVDNTLATPVLCSPFRWGANLIIHSTTKYLDGHAAAERVFRLYDQPSESADAPNAEKLSEVRGELCFQDVEFGYDVGETIIHGLSFSANPGQTVAIVGPTGAGKTTLVNLMMRFYDPQGGAILLDGKDIRNYTRSSLRAAFTMVLQDTWLFEGTIYENIAYGRQGAAREEVERAAREAHAAEFIEKLPEKYDTMLTDGGVNLSKGQKQLITIARAMLSPAKLLILDEATSNVDTRTEISIRDAMARLMQGKTCFVIAHRLTTIRNADLILVVSDGNIVERGKHDELLRRGGFYASMYGAQFE